MLSSLLVLRVCPQQGTGDSTGFPGSLILTSSPREWENLPQPSLPEGRGPLSRASWGVGWGSEQPGAALWGTQHGAGLLRAGQPTDLGRDRLLWGWDRP